METCIFSAKQVACVLLVFSTLISAIFSQISPAGAGDFYSAELISRYGSGYKLNSAQLDKIVKEVHRLGHLGKSAAAHGSSGSQGGKAPAVGKPNNCSDFSDISCLKTQCLDAATILKLYGLLPLDGASVTELTKVSSSVLFQLQNPECYDDLSGRKTNIKSNPIEVNGTTTKKPTKDEVWGYGFVAVTVINVAACFGILFYPIMKTNLYRKILMCMVGLAVGTLSASAILVLIPEAFQLMDEESHVKDIYIWRALTVIGGLYMFFLIERFLNGCLSLYTKRARRRKAKEAAVVEKGFSNAAYDGDHEVVISDDVMKGQEANGHGHSHGLPMGEDAPKGVCWAPMSGVKPVAWMIIFGDALHNFVDGLSIGAAFSENTLAGISLSLAVLCEELPHELGDFAVLLASGMGVCQALLMNFASALTCYIGLVIGIQLGALEQGALWIFAVAGGMFLYIALVDMLPEMNEQAREEEKRGGNKFVVFLLQNLGLLAGWAIILLVSLYGGNISLG